MEALIITGIAIGLIIIQILLQKFFGSRLRGNINGIVLFAFVIWVFHSGSEDHSDLRNPYKTKDKATKNHNYNSSNSLHKESTNFNNNYRKTFIERKSGQEYNSEIKQYEVKKYISEGNQVRVGAVCKDGTMSEAIGRGACSHHGGVAYWLVD